MSAHIPPFANAILATTVLLATASCASTLSSPRQVAASNPSVTYQYRNDDELIQANQRAIAFCEPYRTLPRTQHFSEAPDHQKTVAFECVSDLQTAPMSRPDAELRYDYRTDQELLDVSRNAQVQCRNIGKPDMHSTVVTSPDGTRSVTFHCSPRA